MIYYISKRLRNSKATNKPADHRKFGQTKPPADLRSSVSGASRGSRLLRPHHRSRAVSLSATMASGQNEILSKAEDIADKVSQSRMFCKEMLKIEDQISTLRESDNLELR